MSVPAAVKAKEMHVLFKLSSLGDSFNSKNNVWCTTVVIIAILAHCKGDEPTIIPDRYPVPALTAAAMGIELMLGKNMSNCRNYLIIWILGLFAWKLGNFSANRYKIS